MHTHEKNILFDARCLIGPQTGIARYTELLLLSLADQGVKVDAFYFNFLGKHRTEHLPKHKNINYIEIRFFSPRIISLLNRFHIELPIELLLGYMKASPVLYTNYVAQPSILKRKILLVIYDLSIYDHPEYSDKNNLRYLLRMLPRSIRRANNIITISDFAKKRLLDRFAEYIPESNIVVTPIPPKPLDRKSVFTLEGEKIKFLQSGKYLLYLGTIEPRKNIDNLLNAYALLPITLKDTVPLVLAGGKGWNDEKILAKIKYLKDRGHNIVQTGYVSDAERLALYHNAACFILPSHYEGFGMPILEAMQHNIPVTISDIEVFHEVGRNGATYFDQNDSSDIANKITEALQDKNNLEKIKNYPTILKRYSWSTNARKITNIL